MRLTVSRKTDLALQALRHLASSGDSLVSGAQLCSELGIGGAQLSQVLKPLVAQGWVSSRPGPDGGYQLVVRKLSVAQVVEAIEGPIVDGVCVLQGGDCGGDRPCALHQTWATARAALVTSLSRQSALVVRAR